jgi:AmmeMemoRadiSam system protein A
MNEYAAEERKLLLRLAHQSIRASLNGEQLTVAAPSPHLAEERGAFTTLRLSGKLRGCIGYVLPVSPLYSTIIDTASAAAFSDPRFVPVEVKEEPLLQIEISVLSPLFKILPDQVEVGKHGLMISQQGCRGLLLPQVPVEWGWDRERFLSETCRKAGIPSDAWKRKAEVEGFTAEVFGESRPGESLQE